MKVKCKDLGFKQVYESSNIQDFEHDEIGVVRFYGVDRIDSVSFWGLKALCPDLSIIDELSKRVSNKFKEIK